MIKLLQYFLLGAILAVSLFFTGCSEKSKVVKKQRVTKYTSVARHKATMRSYKVLGKRYNPSYVEVGQTMHGISSWYGPKFHGKYTSNGEIYNMHARTAAHKTWPMDTMVRVKNLENGKSTLVRINDRGPFVRGRIIDCSFAAGKEIGLDKLGIAKVEIQVMGFAGKVQSSKITVQKMKTHTKTRVRLSDFGVQVGAFGKYEGAMIIKDKYLRAYSNYRPVIKTFTNSYGVALYRVWLMGFSTEEDARDFKVDNDLSGAFIVRN